MHKLTIKQDGSYEYLGVTGILGESLEGADAARIGLAIVKAFRDLCDRGIVHHNAIWRLRRTPDGLDGLYGLLTQGELTQKVTELTYRFEHGQLVFHFTHEDRIETMPICIRERVIASRIGQEDHESGSLKLVDADAVAAK